eukprot:gene39632-48974_t
MAEESDSEKTEPASQKRLEQAREEGDVPRSREVATFVVLMTAGAMLWMFGSSLVRDLSSAMVSGLALSKEQIFNPDVLLTRVGVDVGRVFLMLGVGIPLGYALGTLVGDAYAGWSTWDLWQLNRNRFVGMVASSVAISAAFVGFFYQRAKTESLTNQVTQAQLMLLQSQLEPHMLFNTLAHLRALIGQDTARAHAMLDHLNDYLRTTLHASRQPLHPLVDEFSRLDDYLSLMAIRMGKRLVFELDLPPGLAASPVPSFILQPLVENAIRHGLEPQVSGGRIEVQAQAEGQQLLLTVRDNGLGISELALAESARPLTPATDRTTASWGLTHVRQRLHTQYGTRA